MNQNRKKWLYYLYDFDFFKNIMCFGFLWEIFFYKFLFIGLESIGSTGNLFKSFLKSKA